MEKIFEDLTTQEFAIQSEIKKLSEANDSFSHTNDDIAARSIRIKRTITTLDSQIEALSYQAREVDDPSESQYILDKLTIHQTVSQDLHQLLRQAQLTGKLRSQRQKELLRKELLGVGGREGRSNSNAALRRRRRQQDSESALQKSHAFSDALSRAKNMLATQIARTEQALDTLDNSTNTLSDTKTELDKYGDTIKSSKRLVTELTRTEPMDRLLIYVGVSFFFLVCFYILYKRLSPLLFFVPNTIGSVVDTLAPDATIDEVYVDGASDSMLDNIHMEL